MIDLLRRILRRIRTALGGEDPSVVIHRGVVLPAPAMRFGGRHFQEDEDFLTSAVEEAQRLEERCGLVPASRLLEVGCGPGRLAIGILQHLGELEAYRGVDVHRPSIRWCRRHIQRRHPSFRFIHLDVANPRYHAAGKMNQEGVDLPFPTASFDVIYLYSVFSHLLTGDVKAYLKTFQRLLKGEGVIFLTAFVEEGDIPDVEENPPGYLGRDWEGPLHCVRYRRRFLEGLFTEHGLQVDDLVYGQETDGQSAIYLSRR